MTQREFIMVVIFSIILALQMTLEFFTIRLLITAIGTGDMAVSQALNLVMSGKDFTPSKK